MRTVAGPSRGETDGVQGGEAAFDCLVETYHAPIFNFCYRMLGEPAEAEDAAQETFLRAYQHRQRYDASRPVRSWLMAIAAHYCIDCLRRRRLVWVSLDEEPVLQHPALCDPAPGPESAAIVAEHCREIRAQLARLAPRDREVIVMHYWGYLSYTEIATATDSTPCAVKSRLHRARTRLGQLLRQPAAPLRAAVGAERQYAL
jgi:RNA polymerase sigma-70 factor (ECF subfamily)